MVTSKNLLALFVVFSLLGSCLTSCDSGQNQSSTETPPATQEAQEAPANTEAEPTPSPYTAPEIKIPGSEPTITPSPSVLPNTPDLGKTKPAPDNSKYKSVPKDTPMKPDVGNVEPDGKGGILAPRDEVMPEVKKPTPKAKADSKISTTSKANASATRKAMFQKAAGFVPGSNDPKFQEYYKKLDTLVTKIEGQKPLTQESIDAVNKLNLEYPAEASKFNDAMQKVLPNKNGG
jgi:soluble cytochrome b562